MDKNSKVLPCKNTHRIGIRFFFATNCVLSREIKILHELTEEIRGDFYTKPLQGVEFKRSRNLNLNVTD